MGDALGRWGGEEFLLVLPQNNQANMPKIFERIQESLRQTNKELNIEQEITISMGSSTLTDNDDSLESPLKRADEALYRAKNNGHNRLEIG